MPGILQGENLSIPVPSMVLRWGRVAQFGADLGCLWVVWCFKAFCQMASFPPVRSFSERACCHASSNSLAMNNWRRPRFTRRFRLNSSKRFTRGLTQRKTSLQKLEQQPKACRCFEQEQKRRASKGCAGGRSLRITPPVFTPK